MVTLDHINCQSTCQVGTVFLRAVEQRCYVLEQSCFTTFAQTRCLVLSRQLHRSLDLIVCRNKNHLLLDEGIFVGALQGGWYNVSTYKIHVERNFSFIHDSYHDNARLWLRGLK